MPRPFCQCADVHVATQSYYFIFRKRDGFNVNASPPLSTAALCDDRPASGIWTETASTRSGDCIPGQYPCPCIPGQDSSHDMGHIWKSRGGSVCLRGEHTLPALLLIDSNVLERPQICIYSSEAATPSTTENQGKTVVSTSGSTQMAQPAMVSRADGIIGGLPWAVSLRRNLLSQARGTIWHPSTELWNLYVFHVAAISAFHFLSQLEICSVGKHDLVIKFMRGVRCLNPPRHSTMPVWDLTLVFTALFGPPFEPLETAELRLPSLKSVLACGKHIGYLQALSVCTICLQFEPGDCKVFFKPRAGLYQPFSPKNMSTED